MAESPPTRRRTDDPDDILEVRVEPKLQYASQNTEQYTSVCLVGKARVRKEVRMPDLKATEQHAFRGAMAKEWSVFNMFGATKYLSAERLKTLQAGPNPPRIIDTRWVLTYKVDGSAKARLVVVGCQENIHNLRSDAPTGSQLAFHIALSYAAQAGWTAAGFDAKSAYLQSHGIERLLLLRLPARDPPPGTLPNQVVVASGSIYGTRDAGRAFYDHARQIFAKHGFYESRLGKALYFLVHEGRVW